MYFFNKCKMFSVVSGQCKTYSFNITKRRDRYVVRLNEIEDTGETFLMDDNNNGCHLRCPASECQKVPKMHRTCMYGVF